VDSPAPLLSDFLMEKDRIFANLNLDDEELKLYERYYEALAKEYSSAGPGHLSASQDGSARARITKKSVKDENQISTEYIEEVSRAYEHFFFRYEASDLLVIDTFGNRLCREERGFAAIAAAAAGSR